MLSLQTCWRKLLSTIPMAVFCLAVMGMTLPQAAEAALTTVSNNYLINDAFFDDKTALKADGFNVLDTQLAGGSGGEPTEVWRFSKNVNNPSPQLSTTAAYFPVPAAGTNDSFFAPVDLFSNDLSTLPSFDFDSATLDNIYPNFSPDYNPVADVFLYFYTAGPGDIWSASVNTNANQDYRAWYTITLDTVGGTYVATSDYGKIFDPEYDNIDQARNMVTNWNNISWDVDPFAGGGIAYSNINDISVEFFYTNVVPWTADTLPLMFTINEAAIYYTTTFDLTDVVAPEAPPAVSAELFFPAGIEVAWSNSPDLDVASYTLYRSLTSGSNYTAVVTNTPSIGQTEFSYINYGLDLDTTYYYVVTATDVAGNESTNSTEVSATTATNNIAGSIISLNLCQFPGSTAQTIDNALGETFGVASLGTVVSNWNNYQATGGGNNLLTDSGLHSSVSYSQTGNDQGTYNAIFQNTPLVSGPVSYGAVRTITFNNLDAGVNFPYGYYAIVYLAGFNSTAGNMITDGTTTNYWTLDLGYAGALHQVTSTSTNLYEPGQYVVFGSAEEPLTGSSLTLTYQKLVGGGAGIGGVQLVAAPKVPYNVWAEGFGMDPALFPGQRQDDWDGEGTLNVVEFALNGDPTNALDNGYTAYSLAVDSSYLDYMYHRTTEPNSGVTYTQLTATDLVLGDWTSGGYTPLTPGDLGNGYQVVTNRLETTADKGFMKLEIGEE